MIDACKNITFPHTTYAVGNEDFVGHEDVKEDKGDLKIHLKGY